MGTEERSIRRGREEGEGLKGMALETKPIDQNWPLLSLFLYLRRLRGKGKGWDGG